MQFRSELLRAAKAGDLPQVLSMFAPEVRRFEEQTEGGGIQALVKEWSLPDEEDAFLAALTRVLEGGGRFFEDGTFVAPYTFTEFRGSADEMMTRIVVTRQDTWVRARPSPQGERVARVEYAVLRFETGPPGWHRVFLSDGRSGYLQEEDARQPSDPRAQFKKVDGRWMVVMFAKGMD
jgi:hypothetical protein